MHEFTITIDDQYRVYQYIINISKENSISKIINTICKENNINTPKGKFLGFMEKPTTKAGKAAKVAKVISEYKRGTLHAGINPKGPKKAPLAKSRAQAVAIAMSEAGMKKKKK